MQFSKEDLLGEYNWTGNDMTTIYMDGPSRRSFDRFSGEQVLFLINSCFACVGKNDLETGRMLEEMILNQLPIGLKSEITVFNWLCTGMQQAKERVIQ